MIDIPPEPDQYDTMGRPVTHPLAKAIQDAYMMPPPVIPQNFSGAQAPPPGPNQSISASPANAPVDMTPIPATANQQAIKNLPPPMHTDPDVQNSKLRTVLNAIAGGFAGAAGHPEAGTQLRDAKYNKKVQDYKTKLGSLQTSSDIEQQQLTGAEKRETLKVQNRAAVSKEQSAAEANRIREENAQTTKERADTDLKHKEELNKSLQDKEKLVSEQAKKLEQMRKDYESIVTEVDPIKRKQLETNYRLHFAPKETPEEAAAKGAALQKAKDTPEHAAFLATLQGQKASVGEQAKIEVNKTPAAAEAAANIAGAKSDATLTASQKQTRTGAIEILNQYPRINKNLDGLIKSGKLDNTILSRWNEFKTGKLGTNSPELVALRTDLGFLQSKLSQIHTSRTSNEVLKKFEGLMNAKVMTAATLKEALSTAEQWVKGYAADPRKLEEEYEQSVKTTPHGTTYHEVK